MTKSKLKTNKNALLSAFLAFITVCLFAICLVGCNAETADEPQDLTRNAYTIAAEYDGAATLKGVEQVRYVNNTSGTANGLAFQLMPNAFSEDVAVKPYTEQDGTALTAYGGISINSLKCGESEIAYALERDGVVMKVDCGDIKPNSSVTVDIDFTVTLPSCVARLGVNEHTVNLANFYPTLCVFDGTVWFTTDYLPLGDSFFTETADYTVTLTVPEGFVTAASGESVWSKTENGMTQTRYEIENARDFAVVTSKELKTLTAENDGVQISYHYFADDEPARALAVCINAVRSFSEHFGKYQYRTFSAVETPLTAGGMEYSALVMIASGLSRQGREQVIAHETAHQWWYGAVGSNCVTTPWLDEGLTEFSTMLYYLYQGEQSNYLSMLAATADSLTAYESECRKNGASLAPKVMQKPLADYLGEAEYVAVTYEKGALLFATLYTVVGSSNFENSLRLYLTEYGGKIATPDNLIDCFDRTCRYSVRPIFSAYLN